MNSCFTYNGYVTITYLNNKNEEKKLEYKNTGYKPLFDYITNCLIGVHESHNGPQFISFIDNTTTPETTLITASINGRYQGKETNSDESNFAGFTATISADALIGKNSVNIAVLNSKNVKLAEISGDVPNDLSSGSFISVDWKMKFTNKPKDEITDTSENEITND